MAPKDEYKPGQIVIKTMGVFLVGKVLSEFPKPRDYTDGSYREPQGWDCREAVPVQWEDGTKGWIHARFLKHA